MPLALDVPSAAVVVGTDGSAASRRAVDWAVEEADRRAAPVVIVYAAERQGGAVGESRPIPESELTDLGERMVTEEIGRVRQQYPHVTVTGSAIPGQASVVLVEASQRADLVVVGARGLGPFAGALLGSVSQKVAAHAHGTVVVVREEAPAKMPGPVVVGADPADPPVEALEYAFEEAKRRGVGVVVVVATRELPFPVLSIAPDATAMLGQADKRSHERLVEAVDQLSIAHDVSAEVQRLAGHPADTLLGVAGDESIIVVGSRGQGGLTNLLLGSVSTGVLNRALVVVVVRVPSAHEREA
ncbi:universal stress protein [Georgenia daeguensis]|uniref:Universal stress protein n=1 Tax=Georgenia daeguensis TaxID=908355 RepID=A0ABP8EYL6_9MICO